MAIILGPQSLAVSETAPYIRHRFSACTTSYKEFWPNSSRYSHSTSPVTETLKSCSVILSSQLLQDGGEYGKTSESPKHGTLVTFLWWSEFLVAHFVLFKYSIDWTTHSHIREGNLLYSLHQLKYKFHLEILSQTHPEKCLAKWLGIKLTITASFVLA